MRGQLNSDIFCSNIFAQLLLSGVFSVFIFFSVQIRAFAHSVDAKSIPCPSIESKDFGVNGIYTITFNGNGAICGLMSNQNIQEGMAAHLFPNLFFRNGYDFIEWNTEPNGTGLSYQNGDLFFMGSIDITLYAQWSTVASMASPGDYRSRTSGNWGSHTTWEKFDGNCWTACSSGDYPNSEYASVTLLSGHTIDNDGAGSPPWNVKNLIVASGARLWDNQFGGINTYIQIFGNILCNGIIGDPMGDDIAFDIAGGIHCILSGTGSFTAMRIRKDNDINPASNTSLTIKMAIQLLRPETSATVLFNDANQPGTDLIGSNFNVFIDSGVVVKCAGKGAAMCHVSLDGINGADPENCGGSIVVAGELAIDGILYCKNNNSAKSTAVLIKNNGTIKCRYIEAGPSGLAGNSLIIENGGKLIITGSVDTSLISLNNTTLNDFSSTNNTWDFQPGSILEYAGQTQQKIHGINTCSNLVISGGGLKVLDNDLSVVMRLSLINGVIQTNSSKLFQISTDPSDLIHDTGASSFIYGLYRRNIASNSGIYEFPIGLSSNTLGYRRLDLINNHLMGVSFLDVSVSSLTETANNIDLRLSCKQDGLPLYDIIEQSVWKITPNISPSGGTYGVRLFLYGSGLDSSFDNYFFAVKRADESLDYTDWDTFFSTTSVPPMDTHGRIFDGGNGYAERTGYSSFSEHAIGLKPINEPLPIELMDFSASCAGDGNLFLHWSTASEFNSSYFRLEKSLNGIQWKSLGLLSAGGNSNDILHYQVEDRWKGDLSYYRLWQVDINGDSVSYNPIKAFCTNTTSLALTVPNPSNNEFTLLYDSQNENSLLTISITDALSKEVYRKVHNLKLGTNSISFSNFDHLAGMFLIHLSSEEGKYEVVRHLVISR